MYKIEAVLVGLNSHGGSLIQAKNINDSIKKFAHSKS
jgi:ClpP class serine protease